ncbi:hypothetical protein BC827DRAFT_1260619 [Russula dissimulans]|nr:hypothetical protein BC827DRAFT_1260619 [Russula dissimulans]
MSFSGTPLGQGRLFLTRPSTTASTSERRSIPTSYAYGAPTQVTRSPPKPLSTASSRDSSNRAEQQLSHITPRHCAPRSRSSSQTKPTTSTTTAITSTISTTIPAKLANVTSRTATVNTPDPTKWAVKGTSVQAANAIHQAAMALNPKDSWASSSRTIVPRSTSVEYEKETQSTSTRRLNPPPPRNGPPVSRSAVAASKLARQTSPDAPPRRKARMTPLDSVIDLAKRTAFYLRQRSTEPDVGSPGQQQQQGQNGHHDGNNNESYDYAAEEREFQTQSASAKARKVAARNSRVNADNQAYRPTASDLDQSDDEILDEGKRRRRKAKRSMIGPLTTLPVIEQEKRRRRRSRTKADGGDAGEGDEGDAGEEDEDEDSSSDRGVSPQPRELQRPPSRAGSIPPRPTSFEDAADVALDSHERSLDSVAEHDEALKGPSEASQPQLSRRAFSVGGFLGRIVNRMLRLVIDLFIYVLRALGAIMNIFGQALGGAFDALFSKPARWITHLNPAFLLKWLIVGAALYAGLLGLKRTSLVRYIPSLPSQTTTRYEAPEAPVANIAELSERLQALENALASLSLDTEHHSDVFGRLGALESRIQKEGVRASEDRNGLEAVRHEIDALRSVVSAVQESERTAKPGPANDDEARAKLSALEERVDALELGKNSAKTTGSAAPSMAWWSKITSSGKKALSIKASDGQDVTALIGHLVDTAMSRHSKDTIAKADFALHSGGAMPQGVRQQVIGYLTGHGYALGRPPITALHHETHVGHCQLGVTLSRVVRIEEVTIDHVARDMEVWGLVEGASNWATVAAWDEARAKAGEEIPAQPRSLPSSARYVRIAAFEYDIEGPQAVQTFAVDEEVRELGMDFGIVALRVLSNWGQEFTCLYRFRVHGRMILDEESDQLSA